MERITYFDGTSYQPLSSKVECVQRLGELEDAEEQGRLVVLPCAIGTKLHCVFYAEEIKKSWIEWLDFGYSDIPKVLKEYGVTIFKNREEAESALNKKG